MDQELKQYLDTKFADIDEKFAGIDEKFADLDTKLVELRTDLRTEIEKTETKLLRAFHGWARSMEIRVRAGATTTAGMDERLAIAEERIGELERRIAS